MSELLIKILLQVFHLLLSPSFDFEMMLAVGTGRYRYAQLALLYVHNIILTLILKHMYI